MIADVNDRSSASFRRVGRRRVDVPGVDVSDGRDVLLLRRRRADVLVRIPAHELTGWKKLKGP